jgi:hypothetical protein
VEVVEASETDVSSWRRGGQSIGGETEEPAMKRRATGSANGLIRAGHREAAGSTQAMRMWKRGPKHESGRLLRIRAPMVLEMV